MEQRIQDADPDDHQSAADSCGDGCKCKQVHTIGCRKDRKVIGTADVAAAQTCGNARFISEEAGKMTEQAGTDECAEDCDDDDDESARSKVLCQRREIQRIDTDTCDQHRKERAECKVHAVDRIIFELSRQDACALDDDADKVDIEIPRKYRELIVMAIGMATGTETTIRVHANLALKFGATLDEITEVIRIVFFTCGVTKLLPTLEILSDLLEPVDESENN